MAGWGSYSFLFGPLLGLLGVGLLLVISRWASGGSGSGSVILSPPQPAAPDEYGLMIPVASPGESDEAHRLCRILADAGVRSRAVTTTQGLRVMVWAPDVGRARSLLDSAH